MGNSTSAEKSLTQEQKDIRYLGDRMPFGDAELRRLCRCYTAVEQQLLSPHERASFLSDFAVHALDDANATQEERDERALLIQVLEAKILPLGFGDKLYATAFLKPGETSIYEDPERFTNNNNDDNNNTQKTAADVDDYTRMARLEQFFDGLSNCGRRGTKHAVKVLVNCCERVEDDSNGDDGPMIRATELIQLAYRMALAAAFLAASSKSQEEEEEQDNDMMRFLPADDKTSQQELNSFARSIVEHATTHRTRAGVPPLSAKAQEELLVTCEDVTNWVDDVPLFASTLSTLIFRIFCPGQAYPPSRTEFVYPVIPSESAFFEAGSSTLLFVFACLSPALNGPVSFLFGICLTQCTFLNGKVSDTSTITTLAQFHRLYTSLSDGLSFNRLQNCLLGYGGPTLLILRSAKGDLFGAFTASSWKESKDFYGNSDCFLFQLLPRVAVYRPSGNDNNFMYCNSFARSRGYDNQAHGIGFGGTVTEPRLYIAEAWEQCSASSRDLTFENGPLLGSSINTSNKQFDVEALEVWGVGGKEVVAAALGDRVKARALKDAAIQKARKVDKAAFLDDFRSGIIESKAFKHREEARGRADADLDDRDKETHRRFG